MSLASRRRLSTADMLRNELQIETVSTSALSEIFEEEPPALTPFVVDKQFLANEGVTLGPDQYDFVRHFEQILYPETYILMVEEFGEYWAPVRFCNEYAVEWGKGSGKDFCCQIAFSRVANILLSLKNPQKYYGFSPHTYLHMLNVAASAPQAHSVFFKPLRLMIVNSPWFKDKFADDFEPAPQATEIRFKKQLELISGHSQASTLEGKNLVAGIADEISEFPTEEEVATSKSGRVPAKTAKAILSMLKTSGATRFPETYRLAQISFPRYKGDAIEQAVTKARADIAEKGEKSRFYAAGPKATWDVNPRYDRFERIEVPGATQPIPNVQTFIEDYETDPAEARAKYECKPELAERRFFANDDAIFAAFHEVREVPPVKITYYWGTDEQGDPSEAFSGFQREQMVPGWQVKFDFAPDFRPVQGALYTIHGDMAITGDRAGVSMCHVRTWDRRDWAIPGGTALEQRPVVKMDFTTCFEADPRTEPAPREVQIRWYRKLVWELRSRGFYIAGVSFDRFQSADSMQILESWGIETRQASTDRTTALYDTLRDVMYDSRLEGYYNELLVGEIQRLSLLKNGKIDHPPGGSKDLADALAGAVAWAVEVGGDEGENLEYADDGDLSAAVFDAPTSSNTGDLMPEGLYGTSLSPERDGGMQAFQW